MNTAQIAGEADSSPFSLADDQAYLRWRDYKLKNVPEGIGALVVEINDPARLSAHEKEAIADRIRDANMALYACRKAPDPLEDKQIIRALGRRFGLDRLDHNMGADDEGITELEVKQDKAHKRYIPYTNRAIHWHTDGYYNAPEQQIPGLLLHCVAPAASGGENALLDHELAYIYLRDLEPGYIQALMQADAMTIPANVVDGKILRPDRSGPVFSVTPDGNLHMRYTERAHNVVWKDDPLLKQAVQALLGLLHSDSPWIYRGTLQAGQGLICNNVLHDRSGFDNSPEQTRLLYRLRYYDRCAI